MGFLHESPHDFHRIIPGIMIVCHTSLTGFTPKSHRVLSDDPDDSHKTFTRTPKFFLTICLLFTQYFRNICTAYQHNSHSTAKPRILTAILGFPFNHFHCNARILKGITASTQKFQNPHSNPKTHTRNPGQNPYWNPRLDTGDSLITRNLH